MARYYALFSLFFIAYQVYSVCLHPPVDLNTATLSEIDSLPYISSFSAQSIIDIRPICSPQELTASPKKVDGLTTERLNTKWNWYADKSCSDTCCVADASCDDDHSPLSSAATYSWTTTPWSECTAPCNTGTQHRTVRCVDSTSPKSMSIPKGICALNDPDYDDEPISKRVCNTHKCSVYKWIPNEWDTCQVLNDDCIRKRTIDCYDIARNALVADTQCDGQSKGDAVQSCETAHCTSTVAHRNKPRLSPRNADDITVQSIDILSAYNHERCNTEKYYNVGDSVLIARRACAVDIEVYFSTSVDNANIDQTWFLFDAEMVDAEDNTLETVSDSLNTYMSYSLTDSTTARVTLTFPSDGYIGKFNCILEFAPNGVASDRLEVGRFTLYVVFNPYSPLDDVYMTSRLDRQEYVENTQGLIWYGSVNQNTARSWDYDQYNVKNLDISMHLLRELLSIYRNDTVLISRHISYAVGSDICYGKWSEPYTTGWPSGGYRCTESPQNCFEPWTWTGTTDMFDLYRDVLDYEDSVQFCQCWVFAGVSTTVGRSLGIGTRPVTNFQSAHDTDFNRAIEKFWYWNKWSKTFSEGDGGSSDSVWNFHVWNDMYFKRHDFADATHNVNGWQAVDATPQEVSYGGNPALIDDDDEHHGYYQMGPASLAMIKQNINPSDCKWSAPHRARYGCFDQEFVISEVNAYYNLWYKTSKWGSEYTLYDSFTSNPFQSRSHTTIGQQMSTKMPGLVVSQECSNQAIRDCSDDLFDVTLQYKDAEPSGADEPTNTTHHYVSGDTRSTRRRLADGIGSSTEGGIDFNKLDYTVDLIPNEWYISSMLIADDTEDIIKLYGDDFTFAKMSLNVDSFYDTDMYMYCSFTVTAQDYRGDQIKNESVKIDKSEFVLQSGMQTSCTFSLNYTEYSSWMNVEEVPYEFKFAISASVFKSKDDAADPFASMDFEPIVEERDVVICAPKYKLSDRIICMNGLKWDEPSHNLTYDCTNVADGIHIESVGDGFCDAINNVDPCYDGGDCCPTSCIPSTQHFCEHFNCTDDRVSFQNKHYYECPMALSFIDYMNGLFADEHCVNLEKSIADLVCTKEIWDGNTGNGCFDRVNAARDVYGDVKSCLTQSLNSMEIEMAEIIEWAIDCWIQTHNETVNPHTTTIVVTAKVDDTVTKTNNTATIVVVVLVVIFVLALSGIGYYFWTKNSGGSGGQHDAYNAPFVQMNQDNL